MSRWDNPYYDRQGQPIPREKWGELHADRDYLVLVQEQVRGYLVSTVWVGLDHNWGEGPPLIFETMVFPADDSFREVFCDRYATEREAFDGHAQVFDAVRYGFLPVPTDDEVGPDANVVTFEDEPSPPR